MEEQEEDLCDSAEVPEESMICQRPPKENGPIRTCNGMPQRDRPILTKVGKTLLRILSAFSSGFWLQILATYETTWWLSGVTVI